MSHPFICTLCHHQAPGMANMTLLRLALILFFFAAHSVFAQDAPFNRGINLTGWFQANSAQEIQFNAYSRRDFEQIRNLGADVIRLPINLHHMTGGAPDYTLDPLFLRHLDQVADWAEELELHLVLDNHTFDPAESTNPNIGPVLEKVWLQMAGHFKHRSLLLHYEVLNEPHGISDADWNRIQQDIVTAIRTVDTKHTIIIGGAGWNSYANLAAMPVYDDDNLIYTFHFYDPFLFTHQGATWGEPSMKDLAGVPFPYRAEEMPELPGSLNGTWVASAYANYAIDGTVARVRELLDIAIQFREERQVPLFLGELGVLMNNASNEDRVFWYRVVREYLDEHDIAWTAWDYHGGFGLFEAGSNGVFEHDLNVPLLEALGFVVPPQTQSEQIPEGVGFPIYTDATAEGIYSSVSTAGTLDFYSTDQPYTGSRAIHWASPSSFNGFSFDFRPDRDLSFLESQGYAISFQVRSASPNTVFDLRFVDSDTQDPADHPWRMGLTIDSTRVTWDGHWHTVFIPLPDLAEQGAWENGEWYNPQGDFDWSAVDRFEIVTGNTALPEVNIWFDHIEVTRVMPAAPSLSNVTGVNGLFFDPQNPGHGFDFNYHPDGLTVFYYGHTATGERLWLISDTYVGEFGFDQPMAIDFYEITDGEFGAPMPPSAFWGTITITLTSCNSGQAKLDGLDGVIEMNLVRLVGLPEITCNFG